jgi:hypothetical protein
MIVFDRARTSYLRQRVRGIDRPLPDLKLANYEQAKSHWIAQNPEATPAEYTAAVTRLARECGV